MNKINIFIIVMISLLFSALNTLAQEATPTPPALTAVWANEGGDKVTRDELRATINPGAVRNSVWDGNTIRLFGAKNETVSFSLILEAGSGPVEDISVEITEFSGPGGAEITSRPASGNGLFDWRGRNIELFYVRYLQIKGLSRLSYEDYDERHVPQRMRRPWSEEGVGFGSWTDRPDHDKFYPEIAVPLELHSDFAIGALENQSIWCDIFISSDLSPGCYLGTVTVRQEGHPPREIPVELIVRDFTLPDLPSARTMLFFSQENINLRYLGQAYPSPGSLLYQQSLDLADLHFQLAHRHRISLIDSYTPIDRMDEVWRARLNGELFSPAENYDGPGEGIGNNVYSIGTYGGWPWQGDGEAAMRTNSDAWVNWFNSQTFTTPVDYFLYLIDESSDFPQIEQWASWIADNPGPGSSLLSLATLSLVDGISRTPSLNIPSSGTATGITADFQAAADTLRLSPSRRLWMYAAYRPNVGSWATEDDGVSPRVTAWAQFKKKVGRWFVWESTYYDNFQGGTGQTDVFNRAQTFGGFSGFDNVRGETGWNYNNGDGVFFYPGTDQIFPSSTYGLRGPFASLRLKHWRRGIQDVDYLARASLVDPAGVEAIVSEMIPRILWEYGVDDPSDPTWIRTDISWPTDPDRWEEARRRLADIIESGSPITLDSGDYDGDGRADPAVFRPTSGLWALRGVSRFYYGRSGDRPVSGDYNGDGTDEAAIFRSGPGLWAIRDLTRHYFGSPGDIPVPGDYTGNGTCRAGIFRPGGGLWAVRNLSRSYFGGVADAPIPADYNGDGTDEAALFRGANSLWAVKGITRFYFGRANDRALAAAFTGSTAHLPAIFRPETGLWAVAGLTRFYFGTAGDRPLPADYNGDGTAERALFRPASGLWALGDISRMYFGGYGDIPVAR